VEITDQNGDLVPIRELVDTGTTATMLLRQFVAPGTAKAYKGQPTNWGTLGGQFITKKKCQMTFSLPEFDTRKRIQWTCHVDEITDHKKTQYDMIIGTDRIRDGHPVQREAETRQTRALDADYSLCDIKEFVQTFNHTMLVPFQYHTVTKLRHGKR
jgi:hypothetical protein